MQASLLSDERYDFVFGVVGKTTFSQCKGILKPTGIYLENMMEVKNFLKVLWTSISGGKKMKVCVSVERADNLNFIELNENKIVFDHEMQERLWKTSLGLSKDGKTTKIAARLHY
jgi:hypothetical protein